jgi:hypothetical protein
MSHVQCLFCSTDNPAGAAFCNACGRPLDRGEPMETGIERAFEAIPAGNAVVALRSAPRIGRRNARRVTRRAIAIVAGAGVLAVMVVLLYGPSRSEVHPNSPAGSAVATQPATPTEATAPVDVTGSVQREAAAPSSPPGQQPATAERDSNTLSLMEGMRRAAARGESAAASQPVEPAPRGPTVRSTVAGGASAGSTVAGGAAASASKEPAACTDAVVALGLCQSHPAQAQSATRAASSPDATQQSAKGGASRGCTDAAAALGLCVQITTRGN